MVDAARRSCRRWDAGLPATHVTGCGFAWLASFVVAVVMLATADKNASPDVVGPTISFRSG